MFQIYKNSKWMALAVAIFLLGSGTRTVFAIDGGWEDSDSDPQHPNVCAVIGVPADDDTEGILRMGSGVLIHPRVVLTAGHVTDWFATIWNVPPERARISFAVDAFDETQWLEVESYFTHPLYNGYFGEGGHAAIHDLGLVILKEPVEIDPAELPAEGFLDQLKADGLLEFGVTNGTQFTVVGYGWGFSFPPPEPLRDRRGIRRYGPTICMGMMPSSLHFLTDPDGVVTQNGDSGGPTFYSDAEGNLTLVALTTWGSPYVGIDHRYRVDTPDSLDFIYDKLIELEFEE